METKNDRSTETSNVNVSENADIEATKVSKSKAIDKNIPSPRFTKEQLVHSSKYSDNRDLLNALLKDGHSYTNEETNSIIQAFHKKGGV